MYLSSSIEIYCPNALPQYLISFTGSKEQSNINLSWSSANEVDFSHFEIEQSSYIGDFAAIAQVKGGKKSGKY